MAKWVFGSVNTRLIGPYMFYSSRLNGENPTIPPPNGNRVWTNRNETILVDDERPLR